jgi:hypothetical protein
MAVCSLTSFPLLEPPVLNVKEPPCKALESLFCGLSLERNNQLSMLTGITSKNLIAAKPREGYTYGRREVCQCKRKNNPSTHMPTISHGMMKTAMN